VEKELANYIKRNNAMPIELFNKTKTFMFDKLKLVELEEKDRVRNFQPPISGELVMETFNLTPCKEVGEIKNAIKDAILDGKIQNNFEEAFAHMIELGKALNLTPKN
jgi:poly(A) polymerase